jgi:hypothetical protein
VASEDDRKAAFDVVVSDLRMAALVRGLWTRGGVGDVARSASTVMKERVCFSTEHVHITKGPEIRCTSEPFLFTVLQTCSHHTKSS